MGCWEVWRLVTVEKVATLAEIERHWSIGDVLDANEALDFQIDIDQWRRPRKGS